ncbi:MAG: NAD-dependent epimerase/dehydratase family protein [Acidimicrobiales bacterium]|jgi:UDP-glucose 4-epimerase|nr:NAD-dependent epimerase/dehydratase family protein [Acidimicrobiales bacterium]
MGRRVLITGLATFWGGLVAKAMERDPGVDVLIGLDTREPSVELERTEYVRTDENYSILSRIVQAARIDTIVHTFLIVDSTLMRARTMHEINVIGTMNLFAAASAPGSSVRDVVVKSSSYVYGSAKEDPVWFTEEAARSHPPRNRVERSLEAVEGYVRDFAEDNPHVNVTLLRFSNVLGPDISTPLSRLLELPAVPAILGFDPRLQFVHEDDVIRSILFVLERRLPGIYNVAGDGLLPWSEVASICGKRLAPVIPPFATTQSAMALKALGIEMPDEVLALLRFGRGIDNRRLKRAGFRYDYTSAGAIEAFIEALRLRSTVGVEPSYRYERDIEQFFRHSPAVVRDPDA